MFYMQIPFFSLDKTFESGQNLLWKKICDGKYIVTHRNKIVQVEQNRDRFMFSCSQDDFYNIWFEYFDLGTDYMDLFYNFASIDKEYIKPLCVRASGVHIIRQDSFEVKIKSLLGDMFSISLFINTFGTKRKNIVVGKQITWLEFPLPERLLKYSKKLHRYFSNQDELYNAIILLCEDYSVKDISKFIKSKKYYIDVGICGFHKLNKWPLDKDIALYLRENFFLTFEEFYDIFILSSNNEEYLKKNIAFLSYLMKYDYSKNIR